MDAVQGLSIGFSSAGIILSTVLFGYNHSKVGQVLNQIDSIKHQSVGVFNSILGKTPVVPPELPRKLSLHNLGRNLAGIGGSVSLGALAASTLIGQTKLPESTNPPESTTPLSPYRRYPKPVEHKPIDHTPTKPELEPKESDSGVSIGGNDSVLDSLVSMAHHFAKKRLDQLNKVLDQIGDHNPALRARVETTITQIHHLQHQVQNGELTYSEVIDQISKIKAQIADELNAKAEAAKATFNGWITPLEQDIVYGVLALFLAFVLYQAIKTLRKSSESGIRDLSPIRISGSSRPSRVSRASVVSKGLLAVPGFVAFIKAFQVENSIKKPAQGYSLWEILAFYYLYLKDIAVCGEDRLKMYQVLTFEKLDRFQIFNKALEALDSWWLWAPIVLGSCWSARAWKSKKLLKKKKDLESQVFEYLQRTHSDLKPGDVSVTIPLSWKSLEESQIVGRFSEADAKWKDSETLDPESKGLSTFRTIEETLLSSAVLGQLEDQLIFSSAKAHAQLSLVKLEYEDKPTDISYFQTEMVSNSKKIRESSSPDPSQHFPRLPIGMTVTNPKSSTKSKQTKKDKVIPYEDLKSKVDKAIPADTFITTSLIKSVLLQRDSAKKALQDLINDAQIRSNLLQTLQRYDEKDTPQDKVVSSIRGLEKLYQAQQALKVSHLVQDRVFVIKFKAGLKGFSNLKPFGRRFFSMEPFRVLSSRMWGYKEPWVFRSTSIGLEFTNILKSNDEIRQKILESNDKIRKKILESSNDKIRNDALRQVFLKGIDACIKMTDNLRKKIISQNLILYKRELDTDYKDKPEYSSFRKIAEYVITLGQVKYESSSSSVKPVLPVFSFSITRIKDIDDEDLKSSSSREPKTKQQGTFVEEYAGAGLGMRDETTSSNQPVNTKQEDKAKLRDPKLGRIEGSPSGLVEALDLGEPDSQPSSSSGSNPISEKGKQQIKQEFEDESRELKQAEGAKAKTSLWGRVKGFSIREFFTSKKSSTAQSSSSEPTPAVILEGEESGGSVPVLDPLLAADPVLQEGNNLPPSRADSLVVSNTTATDLALSGSQVLPFIEKVQSNVEAPAVIEATTTTTTELQSGVVEVQPVLEALSETVKDSSEPNTPKESDSSEPNTPKESKRPFGPKPHTSEGSSVEDLGLIERSGLAETSGRQQQSSGSKGSSSHADPQTTPRPPPSRGSFRSPDSKEDPESYKKIKEEVLLRVRCMFDENFAKLVTPEIMEKAIEITKLDEVREQTLLKYCRQYGGTSEILSDQWYKEPWFTEGLLKSSDEKSKIHKSYIKMLLLSRIKDSKDFYKEFVSSMAEVTSELSTPKPSGFVPRRLFDEDPKVTDEKVEVTQEAASSSPRSQPERPPSPRLEPRSQESSPRSQPESLPSPRLEPRSQESSPGKFLSVAFSLAEGFVEGAKKVAKALSPEKSPPVPVEISSYVQPFTGSSNWMDPTLEMLAQTQKQAELKSPTRT
jgi:hypothetical protein